MARQDQSHADNVDGDWFVDTRCIGCDAFWNHRRDELDVTAKQTWYSWDALADSMDSIAELPV